MGDEGADVNATRKSRRYAIAFAFGQDLADIDEYQSTRRGKVPIYNLDGGYAVALREGEKAPEGYEWKFKEDVYGYAIWWMA